MLTEPVTTSSRVSAFAPSNPQEQQPVRISGAVDAAASDVHIALLTGGGDKPYALGLTAALNQHRVTIDFIGSNDLDVPELRRTRLVNFFNMRGDQSSNSPFLQKFLRVFMYYWRLTRYALSSKPRIFHILWNNRFELFDRTVLMLFYRLAGKRIVLTAHNINAGKRDSKDNFLNRHSLRIQYKLSDHIFVHTEKMKGELAGSFGISPETISVIPLGINNTVPTTRLTKAEARRKLGFADNNRVILFFGRISPYKGVEYLVRAFARLSKDDDAARLLIVGSLQDCDEYWASVQKEISSLGLRDRITERIAFVPDEETELFFKAADVLVLPYTDIFQSGVLILAYSFGLPVIASDVGSFRDDILPGKTGYIFRPKNSEDLAAKLFLYFNGPLFAELEKMREFIADFASERFSWGKVSATTLIVYKSLEH